jgi:dienelactone hydrolase
MFRADRVAIAIALATLTSATAVAASTPASGITGPAGLYRFAGGGAAALFEQYGSLRLVDYRNGDLRALTPRSATMFVGGPGVSVPTPVSVRVGLGPMVGGGVSSIRVDGETADRVPLAMSSPVFRDGAVKLAGRLLVPPGKGPFPAVVIVPGSVPANRDTYDLWALFFASRGFAVLTYDKRGIGQSTGTYVRDATDMNLHDLAADALAGVAWLRRQPEIDPARIGLSGGSQGGWVIELAASESPTVRFAALQSGPAMSVGRQLAYDALTGDGTVAPTDQQIQAGLAGVPDSGYDPRAAISSLTIPVLWQLGTVDRRMYEPETVADLGAINAGGTHDFTIRLYAGGAHSLRLTTDGTAAEEETSPGFVPGVFPDLAAWLRSHA